jgi:DNA-binding CsgD family transcriptional regulator
MEGYECSQTIGGGLNVRHGQSGVLQGEPHAHLGVPVLSAETGRQMMRQGPKSPSRVGVLLLDSQLRPVHFNAESASILSYPKKLRDFPSLDAVMPAINGQLGNPSIPASPDGFTSGRREYICRAFLLDSANRATSRVGPRFVVILERIPRPPQIDLSKWSEQYQLTTRERETVEHVLKGLSNKEIASKMSISPSTVKSFLKLIMVKVGASNRAGIIAKMR